MLQVLDGHGGFVTNVVISADACKAVTTSGDMLGMVWDLQVCLLPWLVCRYVMIAGRWLKTCS